MLRITVHESPGLITFQLEGRLTGPFLREAKGCWQRTQAGPEMHVARFDLTGLTCIDAAGKAFLAARHAEGAEFIASDCLTTAIVAGLATTPRPEPGERPAAAG